MRAMTVSWSMLFAAGGAGLISVSPVRGWAPQPVMTPSFSGSNYYRCRVGSRRSSSRCYRSATRTARFVQSAVDVENETAFEFDSTAAVRSTGFEQDELSPADTFLQTPTSPDYDVLATKIFNGLILAVSFGYAAYTIFNIDHGMTRGWTQSEIAMRIPLDNWNNYETRYVIICGRRPPVHWDA